MWHAAAMVSRAFADPTVIARVLTDSRLWFMVGLSNNTARAAYGVANVARGHGKTVVPIHPSAPVVAGVQGFATVAEAAAAHGTPDLVDLFVNSTIVGPVIDQAIEVAAKAVWLQLDVIDIPAATRADDAGLDVVMDRCPAIEWPRLV